MTLFRQIVLQECYCSFSKPYKRPSAWLESYPTLEYDLWTVNVRCWLVQRMNVCTMTNTVECIFWGLGWFWGFTLDCHLTMNAHVSNIARTCYFELRRLAYIRRFLTSTATATLVSAFVLSRIDYCNSLLFGSTLDVTSHLQRIQNYAARVILRLPMSSRITIHLKSLHWLPVKVRSTYKIACLCFHCHSSTAPSYVTDMLHKKPLHTRNTRSSSYTMPLLNRPAHSKATLGDRSFSFASSSVWNSIPNDVKCAPSLSSFKSRLKTYLFRSVYKDWTASLITVHMCMVRPCHSFVDGLSKKCINVYFKKPN